MTLVARLKVTLSDVEPQVLKGGSGNLNSRDKWIFRV